MVTSVPRGTQQYPESARRFLDGDGEMACLVRTHDWSGTELGDPATWPQALRTAVRLILNCAHPMYIFWGSGGTCFYNDAYRHSIGAERHPSSLGQPARQVWEEIWDIIGPQIEQVMAGRGATWHKNALVPITRDGRREDVYWTYTYSPIDGDTAPNGVGGVLVVCTKTTETVVAAQRVSLERERLLAQLQQMPGFVAVLSDPEHVFEYVIDAYVKIAGLRDFIGRKVRDVFPELENQVFFPLLDRVYSMGQLTGGLAHDFNNLLAAIGGSVEVIGALVKRGRVGKIDRYLVAAQNSTRRAAALTQRLLAFSRRQTLDPRATDVNRLVAGMEDLIRRTGGPAVELEVVGAGGLRLTKIDPSQLESSLLNIWARWMKPKPLTPRRRQSTGMARQCWSWMMSQRYAC